MMGDKEAGDENEKETSKNRALYEISEIEEEENITISNDKKRNDFSSQGQPRSKKMRRWKYEEVNTVKRKRISSSNEVEVYESPRKVRKQPGSLHWRAQANRASREQNEVMHQKLETRSESNEVSSKFQNIKTMFENLSKPKKIQAETFGNPATTLKSQKILSRTQLPVLDIEKINQTGENQNGSPKIKLKPTALALPRHHPPFDRGRNYKYIANPSPAPPKHPPATKPKLRKINSAKSKPTIKPPAHYEFKPIFKHFNKVVQTDKPTKDSKVIQTCMSESTPQPSNTTQDQD